MSPGTWPLQDHSRDQPLLWLVALQPAANLLALIDGGQLWKWVRESAPNSPAGARRHVGMRHSLPL